MNILIWFSEAFSHYFSLFLLRYYSRNHDVFFICGPPRSGTSWISDVLALYHNLPRPKHYRLPILFESVIHTHVVLNPKVYKGVVFVVRDGRNAYLSLYRLIQKEILSNKKSIRRRKYLRAFLDVSSEINTSHNVLVLMKMDANRHTSIFNIYKKISVLSKSCNTPLIKYEDAICDPIKIFSECIESISGSCDKDRLVQVVKFLSKQEQFKISDQRRSTTINKTPSEWEGILDDATIDFYNKRMHVD